MSLFGVQRLLGMLLPCLPRPDLVNLPTSLFFAQTCLHPLSISTAWQIRPRTLIDLRTTPLHTKIDPASPLCSYWTSSRPSFRTSTKRSTSLSTFFTQSTRRPDKTLRTVHTPAAASGLRHNSTSTASPPSRSKIWHTCVLVAFVAVYFGVYLRWQRAATDLFQRHMPDWRLFMLENFTFGSRNLFEGRWWTLFTSGFSHEEGWHLLFNLLGLLSFAPPVLAVAGVPSFIGLYLGANLVAVSASAFSRVYRLTPEEHAGTYLLGASGSIYALAAVMTMVEPRATFIIFFVLPMPAWAAASGIIALESWRAIFTPDSKIDATAHLGGAVTGLLFWRFKLRKLRV